MRFKLQLGVWSYRAVRAGLARAGRPGAPRSPPRGRACAGSTSGRAGTARPTCRRWRILAGPAPDRLRDTGATAAFAGLETRLGLRSDARFVAVEALGDGGRELATSAPVAVADLSGGR